MTTRILITNDDGIGAEGLRVLEERLAGLGEVWVVAPSTEQSAPSHAVSLYHPLRVHQVGERRYAVEGTPTDCVFVALGHLLDGHPDLVVSGINRGGNVAADVSYSGTVAGAFEAAMRGIPALAASRASYEAGDFGPTAAVAEHLAQQILQRGLPEGVCLNLNVPPLPLAEIKGVVPASLGKRSYGEALIPRVDPRGRNYFWIGGTEVTDAELPDTDCIRVKEGYATVTPIRVDWTDRGMLADLADWELTPR